MYPDGGLCVRTVQHHVLVGPTSERQSDMYHKSLHSDQQWNYSHHLRLSLSRWHSGNSWFLDQTGTRVFVVLLYGMQNAKRSSLLKLFVGLFYDVSKAKLSSLLKLFVVLWHEMKMRNGCQCWLCVCFVTWTWNQSNPIQFIHSFIHSNSFIHSFNPIQSNFI